MINNYSISTDVLSLPESCLTRSGFDYSPHDDSWIIPNSSQARYFNFSTLRQNCSDELINSLKKSLIWYLRERSTPHAYNMFYHFGLLICDIPKCDVTSNITCDHIMSYKGNLAEENDWYLGALSGFLKHWFELGYPGIAPDAYALLSELRIQGNKKGWAVLTFDPEEGPFDEIELHALHGAINSAYANGEISNREFSLIWIFLATGARPIQVAALKIKDFKVLLGDDGKSEYMVSMPRAKQRRSQLRKTFKIRPLIPEVGEVLETWIAQVDRSYAAIISDDVAPGDLPMFPYWHNLNSPGFEHHSDGGILSKEIRNIFSNLKVNSHRTGQQIKINPRRFRYTLGTRAAMENHGEMVVAELLDHSDTQNAKVYIKCRPEIIEHLDRALAMELAPFAAAFAGKIVVNDFQTENSDDPTRIIRHPKLHPSKGGVGRCGTGCAECGALVPIACYVCHDFQAWVDAPHEEVLNGLLEERIKWLEDTGDKRTAYANDNVILAVSQVIQMCNAMKESN